ncbi:MAG: hypothetical protein M3394_09980 [Actinomycetota bacterium]|nr:hypothetical protein [Actinomycetota bacterium]
MDDLVPADDASPAHWVVDGLRGFAESVLSVVPAGFEAYGRVFHPAARAEEDVRWSEAAAAHGTRAHPGMQWERITRDSGSDAWDAEPAMGSLPIETALVLADVLRRHTATPDRCWFAVWEGFGALREIVGQAPSFQIPGRRLHLLGGPIEAVERSCCGRYYQSANLWWPDDRAWCVATEIDFRSTYLGGSARCMAEVVADPRLEATAVSPAQGVTLASDTVNP